MPRVAIGTLSFDNTPGQIRQCVKDAIDLGYRHIDTAFVYVHEHEVGQGIRDKLQDGTVTREDLFVTTKVWNTMHGRARAQQSLKESLKTLQLDYVDQLILHWPHSFKDSESGKSGDEVANFPFGPDDKFILASHDILDTWKGLEDCMSAGLARNIGLSNFNSKQVQRILDNAAIMPCNLLIEVNPTFTNEKMIAWAKSKNLPVTACAPLAAPGSVMKEESAPNPITDPVVVDIAASKGKSPAQIMLKWLLQQGLSFAVSSIKKDHIQENIDLGGFKLTTQEMARISALNKNHRIVAEPGASHHPEYPFHADF